MDFASSNFGLVLLAEVDAREAGQITGQAVVVIGMLAGVLKCWAISRRPTTNTKCALSLMLVLLAFLASSLVSMLSRFGSIPGRVVLTGLLGLLFFGLIIASLVLAILGLVEMSRQPGVYTQGRGQAIWSLVLTGIMGMIFVGALFVGLSKGIGVAGNTKPGQMLTFDDLNFRFRSPDRPWSSFNSPKINKDSKVGFVRRLPEVYFMILAERIETTDGFSCEQLAEIGKAHLESAAKSSRVLAERPFSLNGLNGLLVETEASLATYTFYYQHWYVATNGFAYQLIGYGRLTDRQRIQSELKTMFSRFEQLDPHRTAGSGTGTFSTNYVSTQYGYSVDLTNSAWGMFRTLATDFPAAEFGVSRGDSCFAVVPVWLEGHKLGLDELASGLLGTLSIPYPDEALRNRKPYRQGEYEGVQFDYEREVEKTKFRYRLGILQRNGTAFLVAAWTQRRAAEAPAILDDAFARVHLVPGWVPLLSAARQFTAREIKTQAYILNQAGLVHYRSRDYEKALPFFRAAAATNPAEPLYVINGLQAWQHLDRPGEVLEFLVTQPTEIRNLPEVRAWEAHYQVESSLTDQALTNYAALFSEGFSSESHFSEYIELLNSKAEFEQALAAVHKYLEKVDSITVRILEADVYGRKQDYPKAISLLKDQREKAPFNTQVAGALVQTCLAAQDFNQALEVSREMAMNNRDSAYPLFLRGRSELGLKWYREAKESFEAATKLAPADKTIRSYLEHTSGLLGEGSNTAIKEPIDPVVIPAVFTNTPAAALAASYAKYGAYYEHWVTAISWEPGKEYKSTEFLRVKVLDSASVASFSTLQRPFDPLGEEIFVNEVRVMDSSGRTVSTGSVADYYILDDGSKEVATHRKILNVPIPGLQPGCQVAVAITRRALGKLDGFPFLEHTLSRGFPVRESVLFLSGDTSGLKHVASQGLESEKQADGLCWRVAGPLVTRFEPMQPPFETFAPTVWIADGSARWPTLVTNYLNSIKEHLNTNEALAKLSRDLVVGFDKSERKTSALAAYVQTNYTYKAIEFGRRARVPNKTSEIVRNKYGDCKDHALLLRQMLEAVGVPARLALVSAQSPVQQDLPSLDQFNHMIVYVPEGQGRFIDCTDKGADLNGTIPSGLAGREALILDEENPRFVPIPRHPELASSLEIQRNAQLVNGGDFAVEETLKVTGVHAGYIRNFLQSVAPASRRAVFQRQMELGDAELSGFEVESLEEPGAPLQVRYSYTFKKQFHRTENGLSGVPRAAVERAYLLPDQVENRLTPFEQRVPVSLKSRMAIKVPEGFSPGQVPNPPLESDPRFAVATNRWQLENGVLTVQFECRQPAGQFGPGDYANYRQTMSHLLALVEQEVVFTTRGKPSGSPP